jgi:endoglucanase
MLRAAVAGLIGAALVLAAGAAAAAPRFTPLDPFQQVREMRRGINVLGYDPFWKPDGKARFQARDFQVIRDGGFDTVRVDLNAFPYMDAEGRLDPAWLTKLDWVVETATKARLNIIVDEHNYNECGQALEACRPKLLAFWRQVGARYRDAPASVMFELLNEPNRQLDDAKWNALLAEVLAIVRTTNPTRNVIIGPAFWNSADHLAGLELPDADRHIIVTFHYYAPMRFTHQGASWVPEYTHLTGVTWGSPEDLAKLKADFDKVQAWSEAHGRPILLGEFGAYDKVPMAGRVTYTEAVARAAEARGFAWAYWQFDSDFVAYDVAADRWVEPIHKALVP